MVGQNLLWEQRAARPVEHAQPSLDLDVGGGGGEAVRNSASLWNLRRRIAFFHLDPGHRDERHETLQSLQRSTRFNRTTEADAEVLFEGVQEGLRA